jgi:hypothetical protein
MVNVIALGAMLLLLAWSSVAYAKGRMPFFIALSNWAFAAVTFAAWPLRSVNAEQGHDAVVLSRTGPLGAAAYRAAIADGQITRYDLLKIREASGRDLDKEFGLSKPEQE